MSALLASLNLFVRHFVLALQRTTRLPAPGPAAPDAELVRTSERHLPGAGALVGMLAAFVFALVALFLRGNPAGPAVAAVASLAAALLLTGAAQESAVFRLAEAMARPPSSAGAGSGQGVIVLLVLLAGRLATAAALGAASEAAVLAVLVAAPVVSRFSPLLAAHWAARADGAGAATLRVAALWCLVPLLLVALAGGARLLVPALLGAAAAFIALLRFYRQRPGRFDDARAAALQQACELGFYLGASFGA